jgi:hypothetical protein
MRNRSVVPVVLASLLVGCTGSSGPENPDPRDGSRLIRVGEAVSDVVSAEDPRWGEHGSFDLYRFQAREGERVVIEMRSDGFDTYLVVGDQSSGIFNPLAQDDDSGGDYDARIRFTAPRTGTYWIVAQAFAEYGEGSYTLALTEMPEPRPAVPTALAVGSTVSGELSETDPLDEETEQWYDLYTFHAVEGSRYAVAMDADFDAYLILGTGTADFEEITRNDDSGNETDARIVFEPERSGTYSVRATSFSGETTGDYTITLSELAPAGPAAVEPIALGRTVNASLDVDDPIGDDGSYYDMYSFHGRDGQRVRITMRSPDLDSYLELGEYDGDEFFSDYSDDDSGGDLNARIVATLWHTGEYVIRANSVSPDETGSYTLTLEELPEPGPAQVRPIEFGQTIDGSLEPTDAALEDASHYDIYTFRARAGQRVTITLRSEDFDSYVAFGPWRDGEVEITDADDDSGAGLTGLDSQLMLTIPETGSYAIRANSLGSGETGDYTISLEER